MLEIIATGVLVAVAIAVATVAGYQVVRLYRGDVTGERKS
jgi:hypothetical protein